MPAKLTPLLRKQRWVATVSHEFDSNKSYKLTKRKEKKKLGTSADETNKLGRRLQLVTSSSVHVRLHSGPSD